MAQGRRRGSGETEEIALLNFSLQSHNSGHDDDYEYDLGITPLWDNYGRPSHDDAFSFDDQQSPEYSLQEPPQSFSRLPQKTSYVGSTELAESTLNDSSSSYKFYRHERRSFWRPFRAIASYCRGGYSQSKLIGRKAENYLTSLPPAKWYSAKFPGWQSAAFASICCALLTFLVNLLLTIIVWSTKEADALQSGILYTGDCDKASFRSGVAHFFVNIMSSLLLSGSNYYMQLLTAPTRQDVNQAHHRREWCDIGIPSFRNSWRRVIRPWRTALWICLALSSTPLHLLWNATFFYTPFSYMYTAIIVDKDFTTPNANIPPYIWISNYNSYYNGSLTEIHQQLHNRSLYEEMSPQECISHYSQIYTFDRSDVVVVVEPPDDPTNFLFCPYGSGHAFTVSNDTQTDVYEIQCDVNYPPELGGNSGDLAWATAVNLTQCAEYCSMNDLCVTSIYKPSYVGVTNCWLRSSAPYSTNTSWTENSLVRNPDNPGSKNTSVYYAWQDGYGTWPGAWACPYNTVQYNCTAELELHPNQWNISKPNTVAPIDSPRGVKCYSRIVPEKCKVEYSLWMGLAVTICNFAKLMLFGTSFWLLRKHTRSQDGGDQYDPLLVTVGDAVASFLKHEDETTKDMCLAEKQDFQNGLFAARWVPILPMPWQQNPHRSFLRGIGVRRWIFSILSGLLLPLLAFIWIMSQRGIYASYGMSSRDFWTGNFGRIDPAFTFGSWNTIPPTTLEIFQWDVILANLPQLYLSMTYFLANNYFTCMLAANEYSQFAKRKKALRVSERRQGGQKSAHFLTIPLWYSLLMIGGTTLVGWLASQAVFLAKIDIGTADGSLYAEWSRTRVGYSPLGVVLFIFIAVAFTLVLSLQGLRRLPKGMPVAASCSASISAACHPSDINLTEHAERRVHWGVELDGKGKPVELLNPATGNWVRRCTFTSGEVERPVVGHKYA